tara:strand:- start:1218 stop:1583 length:366 start_codon:yes stop_codon:yes gene_type:complete
MSEGSFAELILVAILNQSGPRFCGQQTSGILRTDLRFGYISCRSNQHATYKETIMAKSKVKGGIELIQVKGSEPPKFRNVAVLIEDHAKLHTLATDEQRSMARQLSVLIRKAYAEMETPNG